MALEEQATATPTETPTISVVVPTYNRAALLPRAVRSVLAQTYADIEIIIVDDASTDETESVVATLDDPRIRYIRHESNLGGAATRNTGIKAARGKLIAFQDSDDEWLLDKLEKQTGLLHSRDDEAEIVYCGFIRFDHGSPVYVPEARTEPRQGHILPRLLHSNFVSTQTLLVPRACFENVGLFDEQLPRFQDWELVIRLAAEYEFLLVDEPLVIAHQTPGNITSDVEAEIRALEIILEKHQSKFTKDPALLAKHLTHRGHLKYRTGLASEGRSDLLHATRIRPQFWSAWMGLAVMLAGKRCHGFISETLRHAALVRGCFHRNK